MKDGFNTITYEKIMMFMKLKLWIFFEIYDVRKAVGFILTAIFEPAHKDTMYIDTDGSKVQAKQ